MYLTKISPSILCGVIVITYLLNHDW
jgi:hypothetical protein